MPRKTAVTFPASFDFAEQPFGTGGIIKEALKRMRGQWSAGRGAAHGRWGRNFLGADNNIPCRIKNRENVIAKTMFRDGYLSRQFQRIGAALIFDFRIESGEKCFSEFGEIHVGALEGTPPKNKISD